MRATPVARLLVQSADQMEQHLPAWLREGQVAEFVEHHGIDAAKLVAHRGEDFRPLHHALLLRLSWRAQSATGWCRSHSASGVRIVTAGAGSRLPARRTLRQPGIPPATFHRGVERHRRGGPEALADRPSRPDRVWSRIADATRGQIVELALAEPARPSNTDA